MTVYREVRRWVDNFDRALTLTTTPEGGTGWTIKDTSSAGTPTYLTATNDGGGLALTCDNTSESQIITLYQNDVLMYDLAQLHSIAWTIKVSGVNSVTTLVAGVANAQNDTSDTVGVNAWFRMEGSVSTTNLVLETDDVTTNNDDKASGETLAATYKKCLVDFTQGLADVRFFVDGARVGDATTFDMSAVTSGQNVQPYIQLQKASGTGTPAVTIAQCEIIYEYQYGA